jgi:hypothetical protein
VTAAYDGKFGYTSSEEGFYFEAPKPPPRQRAEPSAWL